MSHCPLKRRMMMRSPYPPSCAHPNPSPLHPSPGHVSWPGEGGGVVVVVVVVMVVVVVVLVVLVVVLVEMW